ncbi:MAG: glycoside hydrolase family 125 protein [Firmicutes bacterium]|nr:glycoside hydrolase family 125 protein [Bacillota bacterium]
MQPIPQILRQAAEQLARKMETRFPALAPLAAPCFLNTIETTVTVGPDGSAFVITGDIPAMWLRDSAAQVRPYTAFASDPEVAALLRQVIARQVFCVLLDPYANAFNSFASGACWEWDDTDFISPWVWERKYEVDSLCAPLFLSYDYYTATGDLSICTDEWKQMLELILEVFTREQYHEDSPYYFIRKNCPPSDTLPAQGRGTPVGYTGMTWSGFRPSDDACQYGYLIPSNMMAVVALRHAADLVEAAYQDDDLAVRAIDLANQIDEGIQTYGLYEHPKFGTIYAYETDGLGNYNLMDDANVPSLLSIPYLGYTDTDDPVYQNTRRFLLSHDNPYYFIGEAARGIGSPHTPPRYIWHISLIMQILTSTDPAEIESLLGTLARTHAGTNLMHEGFHADDPTRFTRPWFAWANTLFAQMLMTL